MGNWVSMLERHKKSLSPALPRIFLVPQFESLVSEVVIFCYSFILCLHREVLLMNFINLIGEFSTERSR
jgi:hypothetical protein